KYYYYPGMHEPGSMLAFGMNKKFWDSLTASEQIQVEAAAAMENDVMMAEYNARNGASLKTLISDHGVILKEFSDEIYDSFGKAAEEVFAEVMKHGDLTKRIHESFLKSRNEVGAWAKIADVAYLEQRNRVLGL
ncbi:MAG: ABC transporter substrate-binding protein, partial [Rhodospirillaceae bacterium]|nr:ABC transporter substrate-binding protein [Rhodospirillaceae bacterium]